MNITLRHLEIFVAVVKYKSIVEASENLYLSQSAVSMALSEFENRLGVKLFDRIGKKLILNNYGEKIFVEAQFILKKLEEIENTFNDKKFSGSLIIGGTQTIGNYLLPKIIGEFKKKFNEVDLSLIIDNTENILKKLLNFEIDLAFIEGIVNNNLIEAIDWLEDEIVVFSSPKNRLAKKKKLTIKDLENANWILREKGSGTRDIFEKVAYEKLKKMNIFLEINQIEAIKQIVETGIGIGALSILTIQKEIEDERLIKLDIPFKIKRDLKILIHKKKYKTTLLNEFLNFFKIVSKKFQNQKSFL